MATRTRDQPYFAQMHEFYKMVSSSPRSKSLLDSRTRVANALTKYTKHQVLVIVGETGAGKTTQYAYHLSLVP